MPDFSQSAVRILEPQRQNGMSDFSQSAGARTTGTKCCEDLRASETEWHARFFAECCINEDLRASETECMPDFSQSAVRILEPQRQNGMSDFSQSAGARTTGTSEARRASLLDAKKIVSL
ncbi:hypothetical protein BJ912DRAFT_932388 [Pholiota molesta]|nr:hypothetical protein BJ912DRAFT_932388 [Pholiota molesta]